MIIDPNVELEDFDAVNSQIHRECVKLAFKGSVPHGGLDSKDIPLSMVPHFDELIGKGYLEVKQQRGGSRMITMTRRAIWILSVKEYAECVSHVDKTWQAFERDSNVRALILGPLATRKKK